MATKKAPKKSAVRAPKDLVTQALADAKVSPETASTTEPSLPIKALLLEAKRADVAYTRDAEAFHGLPTFKTALARSVTALRDTLTEAERAWSRARLASRKPVRGEQRAEAEKLRALLMRTGRFLFRDVPSELAELDRIAEGDGLADLVADLEDLALFVDKHSALYSKMKSLPRGAAKKARALAESLSGELDTADAQALLAARNRAAVAVSHALTELRRAATFLYGDSPKKLEAFASAYAARRQREARKAKKEKKAPPVTRSTEA